MDLPEDSRQEEGDGGYLNSFLSKKEKKRDVESSKNANYGSYLVNFEDTGRPVKAQESYLNTLLGKIRKQEDANYDAKTIYGSDLVEFAVAQTNDILLLEDLLVDTTHMFVCKNKDASDKKAYSYCIRDDSNRILFYGHPSDNWTSNIMMFFRCTDSKFGYKIFNDNKREILTAVGKQCCFCNGRMELSFGIKPLGSIEQAGGGSYKITLPDGSNQYTLIQQDKGWYDIMGGSKANKKIGEVRQSWDEFPLAVSSANILYGVTMLADLPVHEKYLIFGSSFLPFHQKYGTGYNQRKFQLCCLGQVVLLILVLGAIAAIIVYYEHEQDDDE